MPTRGIGFSCLTIYEERNTFEAAARSWACTRDATNRLALVLSLSWRRVGWSSLVANKVDRSCTVAARNRWAANIWHRCHWNKQGLGMGSCSKAERGPNKLVPVPNSGYNSEQIPLCSKVKPSPWLRSRNKGGGTS